jgi:hypothetical protein
MYNYSLKLTYQDKDNDTIYRKELLDAFNLKEYTDEINRYIDELYNKVKDDYADIIKCITVNDPLTMFRTLNENDCFMILFSWEYFNDNHNLLQAIHNKADDLALKKQTLIDKIQSNKK